MALRRPRILGFVAVFALSLLGAHWSRTDPAGALRALARSVPHCEIQGRVVEQAGGLGTLVALDRADCAAAGEIADAGVVIVDRLDVHLGTAIAAEGWLMGFGSDDWERARASTKAEAAFVVRGEIEHVSPPTGLLGPAASVRRSLVRATDQLETRRAALIRGLTFGDTSDMDESTEHTFRRTGLSHLVAVSGSNVALVLAVVVGLVGALPPSARSGLCMVVLAFYVLVVGPEPSVLRAAAMGAVMLAGLVWGRRSEPLQALGIALVVLLILRPEMVSSVGLQLSAGATAGIVLWGRPLAAVLQRWIPAPVALVLGATLAAQFAVAPLLALVFGEVSVVAPLANVLAFAAVAPATILGLAAALCGLLWPAAGSLLAGVASPCAGWIVGVAETLARPSWAAVEVPRAWGWAGAAVVACAALVTLVGPLRPAWTSTRVAA